jgi:hypothetical protein
MCSSKQATKIDDVLRKTFWEEYLKNREEIAGLCRKCQVYSTVFFGGL